MDMLTSNRCFLRLPKRVTPQLIAMIVAVMWFLLSCFGSLAQGGVAVATETPTVTRTPTEPPPNYAPRVGAVVPDRGSSAAGNLQLFTVTCSDLNGWGDIRYIETLFRTPFGKTDCVYVRYDRHRNEILLRDDRDAAWLGGVAPGTANPPIANSQAEVDVSRCRVSGAGNDLNVTWAIRFQGRFVGMHEIWLFVADMKGSYEGFRRVGEWQVILSATGTPTASQTAVPTRTPTSTPSPTPGITSAPTGSPTGERSPTATPPTAATSTPSHTATRTPTNTATPVASPTWVVKDITFQYRVSGYPGYGLPDPPDYQVMLDTFLSKSTDVVKPWLSAELKLSGKEPNDTLAPLLKFDLFRIPSNAHVVSATLSVWAKYRSSPKDITAGAFKVLRPWKAEEATWVNASASERWAVQGCSGAGTDRARDPESTVTLREAPSWYAFNVRNMVQEWITNPERNYGVILKGLDPETVRYDFASSESTDKMYRPKLRVIYEAPPTPLLHRFGLGLVTGWESKCGPLQGTRSITQYDVEFLRPGWYSDWWYALAPDRPAGIEYVQLIRVRDSNWPPDWSYLDRVIRRNRGALWLIGNEPEDRYQEACPPAKYAQRYRELHTFIKERDSSAQIAIGGVVQPTPLRLRWLDMVLSEYQNRYGSPMPVDIWNIHVQILREDRFDYGASIPVGLDDVNQGRMYSNDQNAGLAEFIQLITEFRQWMKERGERNKPLIISEYGVLYPSSMINRWNDTNYGDQVLKEFMTLSFDYLLQAKDSTLGYPADDNRLVQRWLWYSLNDRPYDNATQCGFNGYLFDWQDRQAPGTLSQFGLTYMRYVYALSQPASAGITVTTNIRTDITTRPAVTLTVWSQDMSKVRKIAISNEPASLYIRQDKIPGDTNTPPNPPPLWLTKAHIINMPTGNQITIPWDVTKAEYGGTSSEGAKTIYVRLEDFSGRWSRLYLQTVIYMLNVPTATPTATWTTTPTVSPTATQTATGTLSPVATPTQTRTPTSTLTPTPSSTATVTMTPTITATPTITPTPTPSTGQLCVRVFHDRNNDWLYQSGSEEILAGARITVTDVEFRPVGVYTTNGRIELFCFTDLPPSNYFVREQDPPGYISEVNNFSVPVLANRTISVSFPDRAVTSP